MSMNDPTRATQASTTTTTVPPAPTHVTGHVADSFGTVRRRWRETRPSFMTTELWLTLAGIAALIIVYNATADASSTLTLWRTCVLCSLLGAAYVVSRGFAKSGTHDEPLDDGHRR